MAYITESELSNRFATFDFWTDDNADQSADTSVVNEMIDLAEAKIDDAASQHYVVPLTLGNAVTADIVKLHCGTFASYLLAARKSDTAALDALREEWEQANEWLKMLREGDVDLQGETQRERDAPGRAIVSVGDARVMTRSNMKGW